MICVIVKLGERQHAVLDLRKYFFKASFGEAETENR